MMKNENIAITAMEECSEVAQAISKVLRFGVNEYLSKEDKSTHGENVLYEFYQLQAVIEYLQHVGFLPKFNEQEIKMIKTHKITKMEKYQQISIDRGLCT